jgi:cysteinyl-tRNA synthetase
VRDLELREPGKVSMYVCGPTVYADPHVGHGRFTLVWDVVRRYLEWSGLEVRYVSNITDIEDKIINKALEEGCPTDEVVRRYETSWWDAMKRLNVRLPDDEPHATEYVQQMVDAIARMVDGGSAYVTSDGVYFVVESVPDYGLLARQSLDSLRAGGGERTIVGEAEKRSPLDFALWKLAKPGEPSWPSPWGDGRPGWHIECTVMALDLLGDDFDLHGGGNDLAFPHHENERAQAHGLGRRFARRWVHSGMVESGGQKMSKSIGNVMSLSELLDRYDGRAFRLLVLRSHYRSPIEVTETTLSDAERGLERLDSFARRFPYDASAAPDAEAVRRFRELMDDDLSTPQATALLFDLVGRANSSADPAAAAAAHEIATAFGLTLRAEAAAVPDDVQTLVRERDEARASKDWARSDAIRDELQGQGWVVEDTPDGTKVRR